MGSKHSVVVSYDPIPIEDINPNKPIVIIINDTNEAVKVHVSQQFGNVTPHEMSYFNTSRKQNLVVIYSVIYGYCNEIFRKKIENNYFVKVTYEDIASAKG